MLKLKNIKRNNGIISAEYDPENTGEVGRIEIDIKSMSVVKSNASKQDEVYPIYLNHAINGLKKLAEEKELPKEKLIMWH